MRTTLVGLIALFGSGPALAQEMVGDPAAGEAHFEGQCVSCHVIKNEAGEVLAGKGSLNLFGVAGSVPGSVPLFSYSNPLIAYGQSGAVWEEANFVSFVHDPTAFLQEATGQSGRSRMPSGLVTDEQQLHDLWAYLVSFSPAAGGGAEGEASTTAPGDGEAVSE